MDLDSMTGAIRDTLTVRRVFGEPYERDGVTVIPVATVREGEGGGFGLIAKPVGVYVIRGDEVVWQPVLDLNRVIAGGQLVALAALLLVRLMIKRRSPAL
jgi:uncharacterized spore protein YtfJ